MKTKIFNLTLALLLITSFSVLAQSKKEKFEVKGNCGMCKTRIEKAALSVDGVSKANWNQETKILAFTYNESKTSIDKIQTAIAKVGHDTPLHKANDDVYNKLPGCCKYDRTEPTKK